MEKVVVRFDHVTKSYQLFKNDKMRLLSVFNKKVAFSEKKAVNDVSFTIRQGESVAIFGRNGAGKSTVLKMITGVTFPTRGDVKVEGTVSALLELTAGFDMEMTGRQNIYLKGQLMGFRDTDIEKLEPTIVDFAEIGEYIDQPVRTYSSGMKAKLGFAINVNIDPEILIVDEALSVGDASFKDKCLSKVNEIIDRDHVTLLFVTHATGTAREFCKRGIVMQDGAIVCDTDIDMAIAEYDKISGVRK